MDYLKEAKDGKDPKTMLLKVLEDYPHRITPDSRFERHENPMSDPIYRYK